MLTGPLRPTNQNSRGVVRQRSVIAYEAATPVAPHGNPTRIEATVILEPITPHLSISRERPWVMKSQRPVLPIGWNIAAIPRNMNTLPASLHFAPSSSNISQSEVAIAQTTAGI